MRQAIEKLDEILGLRLSPQDLSLGQLLLRALIICLVMYVMIRLAGRRFFAQKNSFDVLLAFLMASLISRAINGSTNFWGTIALGLVLAVAYRLMAALACKFHGFGKLLKGEPVVLIANGVLRKNAMNHHHVSEHDLHEDLRLAGNIDDLKEVKTARLERSGEISVQRQPQIFKIEIKDGVQTIHLLIE
ncbi:MAG TPA: YetF domain-containing protein [Verrucomicrobiae bacterium]|jgi:uncharacterized membrane protein YcaP (DUF421 family)